MYCYQDDVWPIHETNETITEYKDCLVDWDNKNYQIITWIFNTSVPDIYVQFDEFETTKEI